MNKKNKSAVISAIILLLISVITGYAQEEEREIKELRTDIQTINLLNSLDLRKEQKEFIIAQALKASNLRKSSADQIAAYKEDALSAFSAIKEKVEAGMVTVDKEDARRFNEVKGKIEAILKDTQTKIDTLADNIETKLEQFQLIALDGYKPCIIPIMAQGRIGQSETPSALLKTLERVQAASEVRYASTAKDQAVERILEVLRKKAPAGVSQDEAYLKQEILKTFEAVRNMDKADFLIKKETIAKELHDKIIPKTRPMSRKQKISKFLLSENIINILEKSVK